MKDNGFSPEGFAPRDVFLTAPGTVTTAVPVWFARENEDWQPETLSAAARRWLEDMRFTGAARRAVLVPGESGRLAGVAFGLGNGSRGDPSGPAELLAGHLPQILPPGHYRLARTANPGFAAVAWGLGAYRFRRYKSENADPPPRLVIPAGVDAAALATIVEAVWLGRDLINTPASDMGPDEIERAFRALAARHGAGIRSIVGDALIAGNFPLIHAVGRASARAPRLIDLTWRLPGGKAGAPQVTIVGKGVAFDTGGLDIKPAAGMLLMKKDMAGAAAALSLAHMIMGRKLDVRLRVLIPAVENSIAGNAFRPGDVLRSRSGATIEIGNTDAEGRLILADALALAGEETPHTLIVLATLTGAARTALGPDVPAFFTDDDALAAQLAATAERLGDPLWRLPLWPGYDPFLDSEVADMSNTAEGPFAGAITAALFLRRFARRAKRFIHVDLYGWRHTARPLGPKGGEPQAARALFALLSDEQKQ